MPAPLDEVIVRIGNRATDHRAACFRLCKTEIQGEKKQNAENNRPHTATFRTKKMVESKHAESHNVVSRLLISYYGKDIPNDQISGVPEFGACLIDFDGNGTLYRLNGNNEEKFCSVLLQYSGDTA